eukprot:5519178-Alexandrium_andersonii.AAC.1
MGGPAGAPRGGEGGSRPQLQRRSAFAQLQLADPSTSRGIRSRSSGVIVAVTVALGSPPASQGG